MKQCAEHNVLKSHFTRSYYTLLHLTLVLSRDYDVVITSDEIISHQHLSTVSFLDIFIWLQCTAAQYIRQPDK